MRKFVGVGVALWVAASSAWAVDWKALKPQGYVSDFAGVVDPASKSRIETFAASLRQATGAEIALVTIPTLQGEPVEDVANALARAWGVGRKGANDGILLLLSVQDRRSRLEIGDGLRPILPGSMAGSVLGEMRPALRAQKYGEAMMAAAETLGTAVARARHVSFDSSLQRHMRPNLANSLPWPLILLGMVVLGVLGFLLTRAVRRAGGGQRAFHPVNAFYSDPPLVLASGAPSGGGFGSYDSSDSFGGFGGGDFGGGGASSDW
jgi:uncharacterized protein